jgi:bifunctional non-homologous end joining protein LigD
MGAASTPEIPRDRDAVELELGGRAVRLSNLRKTFWPGLGVTKGDLLRWYAGVSKWLLPHLRGRAMVMKRYPQGAEGPYFFMKRAPSPRPEWLRTCRIEHRSGNVIDFPVIDDLAGLLWVVNLGCIDLNPWYARCDDADRPDYLHFDLDPGSAPFARVRDVAAIVHEALEALRMPSYAKTSGSKGIHVYVPIARGPRQKEVWTFAKALAKALASRHPTLATAEYKVRERPKGRVLIDYNQNAWGRTLASVYSVRPTPRATISMPIRWRELDDVEIDDFRIDNARARLARTGDLFAPLAPDAQPRVDLARFLEKRGEKREPKGSHAAA